MYLTGTKDSASPHSETQLGCGNKREVAEGRKAKARKDIVQSASPHSKLQVKCRKEELISE